ncbi:hypothetical protein NEOKW01_0575 [Nematocida sp. AWRm80]|nr:hypothetical protein NEOKW01_0575 [Nematocida sp. AWRm80]
MALFKNRAWKRLSSEVYSLKMAAIAKKLVKGRTTDPFILSGLITLFLIMQTFIFLWVTVYTVLLKKYNLPGYNQLIKEVVYTRLYYTGAINWNISIYISLVMPVFYAMLFLSGIAYLRLFDFRIIESLYIVICSIFSNCLTLVIKRLTLIIIPLDANIYMSAISYLVSSIFSVYFIYANTNKLYKTHIHKYITIFICFTIQLMLFIILEHISDYVWGIHMGSISPKTK